MRTTKKRLEPYPTKAENQAAHCHIFPYELAVVLSSVVHLSPLLTPSALLDRATSLELDVLLVDDETASKPWTVRIWKLAVRVVIYQRVRGVGALHPVVQSLASDLVREFGRYDPRFSSVEKSLAFPLFLAGTVSLREGERDLVRALWGTLKPERGWDEPRALLERVWAEMDGTGRTVQWVRSLRFSLSRDPLRSLPSRD